jgi:ATP-binding protein involved in chromosome partitioning
MTEPTPPSAADVEAVLSRVIDPELGADIVTLGMVDRIRIADDGVVRVRISLTTSGCPLRAEIQRDARARMLALPGVHDVHLEWGELNAEQRAHTMATARKRIAENPPVTAVPDSTRVILIASGKGGVGKSSVTANLAAALAARGHAVGVVDADIWGHSIPPMLGITGRLGGNDQGKIAPHSVPSGEGRLDVVSMGFLVDREDSALMWRGLVLNRAVQHFLEDVDWATDLDYLLIDMPPGTGDVQMGIAKLLPRAEMLVITTPARTAQKVAARAISMGRQNYLRVLGVIENMSEFVAPDGSRHAIFGSGGGQELAEQSGVELIGRIPIETAVAHGGDVGEPVVLGDGPAATEFQRIAERLATELSPPAGPPGCTAHMFDLINAALDAADTTEPAAPNATKSA